VVGRNAGARFKCKSREGFEALQAVRGKRFFVKLAIARRDGFALPGEPDLWAAQPSPAKQNKPVHLYCVAAQNQRKTLETKQKAALLRHFHPLRFKVSGPYKTGGMAIR